MGGDTGQVFQGHRAEWPAGSGYDEAADVALLSLEALPDGAGLAVHREDGPSIPLFVFLQQGSGNYDGFLVGQGHRLAIFEGVDGGHKAGRARGSGHHHVHFGQACHLLHRNEGRPGRQGRRRVDAVDVGGLKLVDLLTEQFVVGTGGQSHHPELGGEGADDVQGLTTDGARASEDYNILHSRSTATSR